MFSSFRAAPFRAAPFLGLATLVALGLAAAPAQAQTLTLNNATAIVSANGTSAGGDYAYGDGADFTTRSYKSVDVYGGSDPLESAISLQDGGSITSLNLHTNGYAYVDGGSVGSISDTYADFGGANFSVTAGSVGSINFGLASYGTISGGTVGNVNVSTGNLDVSGGSVGDVNSGYLNVTGGSVGNATASSGGSNYQSVGEATVTGGSLTSLTTYGDASVSGGSVGQLNLNVGEIENTVVSGSGSITGGQFNTLTAYGGLNYDIEGSHDVFTTGYVSGGTFKFIDTGFYGGYDLSGTDLRLSSTGLVTGFLTDGQAVDAKYVNSDGLGFLDFNGIAAVPSPVPEASTTVSFGLLLCLGGLAVAAKRKKARA